jgi:hypothetical protein
VHFLSQVQRTIAFACSLRSCLVLPQVQEAVQLGRLVIDEQQHAQIQQQEILYNQLHMKRLEIYEQNKQVCVCGCVCVCVCGCVCV